MKHFLYAFLCLANIFVCHAQSKDTKSEINLVAIWTLTDFDNPERFNDIWEFKANGIFNELKRTGTEGSETGGVLKPDENGTWSLKEDILTQIVTGEDVRGKPFLYDKPVTWKFQVEQVGEDFKLTMIYDSNSSPQTGSVLRLAKHL